MNKQSRVINYFCVVGIGKKLIPQNAEIQRQKQLTKIELIQGNLIKELPQKENEMKLDLDGQGNLLLRATFDQPSEKPITDLKFLELAYENDYLKIPISCDYEPCQIRRRLEGESVPCYKGIQNGFSYYQGQYDLTSILECEPKKKNHQTVLCYRIQSQNNFEQAICDLKVLQAEKDKKQRKHPSDYKLIIPQNYNILEFAFGQAEKNRFIAFKKKLSPFKVAYMPHLVDRYPIEDHSESPLSQSVPMFCFPYGVQLTQEQSEAQEKPIAFDFVLTSEKGDRTYCSCIQFYEKMPLELYSQLGYLQFNQEKTIKYPKAICLLSNYNYSEQCKELLRQLYSLHLSKQNFPLERIICNMVDQIRLPTSDPCFGKCSLKYDLQTAGKEVVFSTNLKYPVCSDEAIKTLFTLLDIEKIVFLFECVLLEKKIHLISNHIAVPGLIIEALTTLIFPFEYTHILIPVLPEGLKSYTEAPVPFMIGYSQKKEQFTKHTQSDSIYAFLDTNFAVNIEILPGLPDKPLKRLMKRLAKFENYYSDDESKELLRLVDYAFLPHFPNDLVKTIDPFEVRDIFLEFNCSIMKGYQKYMANNQNHNKRDFKEIFRVKDFLSYQKAPKDGFLERFLDTRFFQYFIQERSKMSINQPIYEFFDKCIEVKKTKKDTQMIKREPIEKIFHVPQPDNVNTKEEKQYRYESFPQLSPDLFLKQQFEEEEGLNRSSDTKISEETLANIESIKWAKYILEVIFRIWFQFFIIKVRNNIENEHYEKLTDYAIFLIDEMKYRDLNIAECIFQYTLEACGYFQMEQKALQLVHLMKKLNIDTSAQTHGVFFLAIAKSMNQKGIPENRMSEFQQFQQVDQDIEVDKVSESDRYSNVSFQINDMCPHCNRPMQFEEIVDGFKKNYFDSNSKCLQINNSIGCGMDFQAKFQVTFYRNDEACETQNFELLNPLNLNRELENIIKKKGETFILSELFEKQYKKMFMNILLYMNLIQVPYFFIYSKSEEDNGKLWQLESCMQGQLKFRSQNTLIKKIAKELDIYKQEFEKITVKSQVVNSNNDSSGSIQQQQGSTKFESKTNFASKGIKKIFSDYVKVLHAKHHGKA